MRRIALLSLTTLLGGCGYHTWWNIPFTTASNPNMPVSNSVNMGRVMGQGIAVTPLTTEPGDIWPGPLPPPKTLQDLSRQAPISTQPGPRGAPSNRGGNPLLAPLPYPTPGGTGPATDQSRGGPGAVPPPPTPDRRIIVPNGNGTSTVIHPDGRIETIPTPK